VRPVTAPRVEMGTFNRAGGAMQQQDLRIGAKVVVSTTDGDMEDEVTRILVDADSAGIWVVETVRNGRVIVMRGSNGGFQLSPESYL
jgi:hypothetical protein